MNKTLTTAVLLPAIAGLALIGCEEGDHTHDDGSTHAAHGAEGEPAAESPAAGGHAHADGTTHAAHGDEAPAAAASEDTHMHEDGTTHAAHGSAPSEEPTESLGTATIGDMEVKFAQGHGVVAAGKEGHLVVMLPENDNGETIVRVWLGTEDRDQYIVTKADYTASKRAYDAHAVAPDPLPQNAMWWVEVEKPDGTTATGSVKPQM